MICTKCNRDLPETEFNLRSKTSGKYRRECKDCNKLMQKMIYDRNVAIINEWKSQGCAKCGEKRVPLIDAHHVDSSTKEKDLCKYKINASVEKLQQELDKCIPFCANCHRYYHHLERTEGITLKQYMGM